MISGLRKSFQLCADTMYDDIVGTLTTNLLTFEEFEQLPDDPVKRELLEGELIEMPPADLEHGELGEELYVLLREALRAAHSRGEAASLGKVHHELGYRLSRNSYVIPDVSITHAAQSRAKYLQDAPALAIEIISPSNTARVMEKKLALYFRFGAREVWHLYRDPLHFVIHYGDTSRTIREGSVSTQLLPGFELPLTTLQKLREQS
jgi:Uma2 family endonuclease